MSFDMFVNHPTVCVQFPAHRRSYNFNGEDVSAIGVAGCSSIVAAGRRRHV